MTTREYWMSASSNWSLYITRCILLQFCVYFRCWLHCCSLSFFFIDSFPGSLSNRFLFISSALSRHFSRICSTFFSLHPSPAASFRSIVWALTKFTWNKRSHESRAKFHSVHIRHTHSLIGFNRNHLPEIDTKRMAHSPEIHTFGDGTKGTFAWQQPQTWNTFKHKCTLGPLYRAARHLCQRHMDEFPCHAKRNQFSKCVCVFRFFSEKHSYDCGSQFHVICYTILLTRLRAMRLHLKIKWVMDTQSNKQTNIKSILSALSYKSIWKWTRFMLRKLRDAAQRT